MNLIFALFLLPLVTTAFSLFRGHVSDEEESVSHRQLMGNMAGVGGVGGGMGGIGMGGGGMGGGVIGGGGGGVIGGGGGGGGMGMMVRQPFFVVSSIFDNIVLLD